MHSARLFLIELEVGTRVTPVPHTARCDVVMLDRFPKGREVGFNRTSKGTIRFR